MLINSLNDAQDNIPTSNRRPRSRSIDDESGSLSKDKSKFSSESEGPDIVIDILSKNSVRSKSLY